MKILDTFKGFIIGASMLIPGVSGGTMAMITGIYNDLLTAVGSFLKHKKKYALFILRFSLGGILGILILAKPLLYLYDKYTLILSFFFIGTILGGIPMTIKEAKIKKIDVMCLVYVSVGFAIALSLSFLPQNIFTMQHDGFMYLLFLFLAGIVAAVALVLPGISVSYMLLIMGLYEPLMTAISEFDIMFLSFMGIGLIIGIVSSAKAIEILLNKFTKQTYLIILGFVFASMSQIFPGIPVGMDLIFSIVLLVAGFLSIYFLSKVTSK